MEEGIWAAIASTLVIAGLENRSTNISCDMLSALEKKTSCADLGIDQAASMNSF